MNNTREGLKSLFLEVENFKSIDSKVVNINGKSMLFMGKNGKGKSSLIQALKGSLNSAQLPSAPIKKGEESAKITHKIGGEIDGEHKEYTIEVFFTPKNQTGRFRILNEKGEEVKSPATTLKSLIGSYSFSVTDFIHAKKADKIEMIKKLTGRAVEIDTLTVQIKDLKDKAKFKKERAESLEGALNNHGLTREEIEKFSTPLNADALNLQLAEVSKSQQNWDHVSNKKAEFEREKQTAKDNINRAHSEIEQLQKMIEEKRSYIETISQTVITADDNIRKAEAWLNEKGARPDATEISNQISMVSQHNEKCSRIAQLAAQQREAIALKEEVEQAKTDIKVKEHERSLLITGSQLPIEGLSFDDNEIYLNGLPLEEGQQNTALIWKLGVQIAIAMNPNYKVIFLDEGSLLDHDMLREIFTYIEDKGYMAIVEIVADNEEVECIFTEEAL